MERLTGPDSRAGERPVAKAGTDGTHRRNRRLRQKIEAWSVGVIGFLALLGLVYAAAQQSGW